MNSKKKVKSIAVLISKWSIIDYLFLRAILSREPLNIDLYFTSLLQLIKFSNSEKMLHIMKLNKIRINCYLFFPFCLHPVKLNSGNNFIRKIILKFFNNKLGLRIEFKYKLISSLRLRNSYKEFDEIWLSWSNINKQTINYIEYLTSKNNSMVIFTPDALIAEGYTDISEHLKKIKKNCIFLFHNKILYKSFNLPINQSKKYIELEKKAPFFLKKSQLSNYKVKILYLAQKTIGDEIEIISFQKQLKRLKKINQAIYERNLENFVTFEFRQRGGGDYEEQFNQIKKSLPNIVIVRASDVPLCEQMLAASFVISEFTSAFFYSRYFFFDQCRFMYKDTSFDSYTKTYESIENEYAFDIMKGSILNESEILYKLQSWMNRHKVTIVNGR